MQGVKATDTKDIPIKFQGEKMSAVDISDQTLDWVCPERLWNLLETLKTCLYKGLSHLLECRNWDCLCRWPHFEGQGVWTGGLPEVPSHLNRSVIL